MQVSNVSGGAASAQLFQFGAETTRSTDLQVVTAEGDRVTIATNSVRTLGYASASGQSGDASVAGAAMQVSGFDRVSISVEGDLSRDELNDLQKMIKAFQQAASRGDAARLLDRLSKSDMDTIASVSGSASTETVVTGIELAARTSSAPAPAQAALPPPPKPPEGERADGPAAGFRPASLMFDATSAVPKGHANHGRQHHRDEGHTRGENGDRWLPEPHGAEEHDAHS